MFTSYQESFNHALPIIQARPGNEASSKRAMLVPNKRRLTADDRKYLVSYEFSYQMKP